MAKAQVVHSEDAVTVIFKGNPKSPEPSTAIVKFPGGHVEVARCLDNSYWIHFAVDHPDNTKDSRIDYAYEEHLKHGIIDVPDADKIKHLAVRIYQSVEVPS